MSVMSGSLLRGERVRPVLQMISGRLRCEDTIRHRYVIRGYTTAGKHGTVLTALGEALLGCPWMHRSRPSLTSIASP
jgi:hypothetical protein